MKLLQERLVKLAGIDISDDSSEHNENITETRLRNIIRNEIKMMLEKMESDSYDEHVLKGGIANSKRKQMDSHNARGAQSDNIVVGFLGHGFMR
jgi:hypothetical protein